MKIAQRIKDEIGSTNKWKFPNHFLNVYQDLSRSFQKLFFKNIGKATRSEKEYHFNHHKTSPKTAKKKENIFK
jgi:hypothetical protein